VKTRYALLEEIAKFFDSNEVADIAEITNSEVKDVNMHHNETKGDVLQNVE